MNLLFDLGGVITDIKRTDCEEAFRNLGFANISDFLGDYGQKGPFLKIEEGAITPAQFRDELRQYIPTPVTDSQIDHAFNAFITGIPLHRLQMLLDLRQRGLHTYVISNTNPIMWADSLSTEFQKIPPYRREDYFDGIVTSFEAGCCKPDERIFRLVEQKFNILPSQTYFFDDSLSNCQAAEQLGFHSIHVPPGTDITEIIARLPL